MRSPSILIPLLLALLGQQALAVQVVPTSYSMSNGTSGAFTYFDDTYSGSGCKTCPGAFLSGGLGDLTDGIFATLNWNYGNVPWVGWSASQVVTFNFAPNTAIDTVSFRFDDSNSGGVAPPASVTIGGQVFAVTDPVGTAPFTFTVSGLNLVGSSVPITITTRSGSWMMLSEVTFQSTSAVPEPGTALLMLLGAVGLLRVFGRSLQPVRN